MSRPRTTVYPGSGAPASGSYALPSRHSVVVDHASRRREKRPGRPPRPASRHRAAGERRKDDLAALSFAALLSAPPSAPARFPAYDERVRSRRPLLRSVSFTDGRGTACWPWPSMMCSITRCSCGLASFVESSRNSDLCRLLQFMRAWTRGCAGARRTSSFPQDSASSSKKSSKSSKDQAFPRCRRARSPTLSAASSLHARVHVTQVSVVLSVFLCTAKNAHI